MDHVFWQHAATLADRLEAEDLVPPSFSWDACLRTDSPTRRPCLRDVDRTGEDGP